MSDEPIVGNQPAGGQGANPAPSAPGGQPSAVDYAKEIQGLQAQMRALQSEKDKRWVSEVAPLKDQVARLAEALGIDEKDVKKAQTNLALQDLADAYNETLSEPSSQGSGDGQDLTAKLETIATALDLPENDPRVADLFANYGNDPAQFAIEAAAFKNSLATGASTPAEQLAPSGAVRSDQPETDAQKRARIFGDPSKGIFDINTVRGLGGGVYVAGKKVG